VFNQDSGSPATLPQQAAQLQRDVVELQKALGNPRLGPDERRVLQSQLNATMAKMGQAPVAPAGGMVSVVKPDGTTGQIPAEKLKAALAAGYKQR
jgi:hypothetical protein